MATQVQRKTVWVLGAKGYSGIECCRLVLNHPALDLTGVFATEDGKPLSHYVCHPFASALRIQSLASADFGQLPDVVLLATPTEVSMEWVKRFRAHSVLCVDLSGAYRLPQMQFESAYAQKHFDAEGLSLAQYGLVPFNATKGNLISNPGCFVTAILMALIPPMKLGLLNPEFLVVDAKTGTTGAGKKPVEAQLYAEVAENCTPYKIGNHQHAPEILQYLEKFSGVKPNLQFSTHLLPVRRGILASIYARPGLDRIVTERDILGAYQEFYAQYPLVEYGPYGETNLALSHTAGTAMTRIGVKVVGSQIYLFSVIDNLLKGAASQALENVNRYYGWPVELGLISASHSKGSN